MLPRVDFRPNDFDNIVNQKGFHTIWEQGMYCSCYTDSGQPDYNCPTCGGRGYLYFGAKKTRCLVTSIKGKKVEEKIGLDDKGSAYLTSLTTDNIGFRDRFTFPDFTMKYSDIIKRDASSNADPVRYHILEVIMVRALDRELKEEQDFVVSEDRKSLIWSEGSLEPQEQYSILYTTRPVYIAINPIHELRGSYSMYKGQGQEYFTPLPKQFQIKREDFLLPDDLR